MIDRAHLDGLREDLGDEDFREVLDLSLEELADILRALGSSPGTAEVHHTIKGLALNLGLVDLAGQAAAAETDPVSASPDTLRDLFDAAREALHPYRGRS